MTSAFDDGAPDWAPDFDTTTGLDDDDGTAQGDTESELFDADTDHNLERDTFEGGTEVGTDGPVDYWDPEQTLGNAAEQPHFGQSVTARDDDLGHDVDVRFSSPGSSWGKDSEGRDVWRDANGSLRKYE